MVFTPRIVFKYSWIYDKNLREWMKAYKKRKFSPPSEDKIKKYIPTIEKLWRKDEKKVLTELSKVTGLKWESKQIICYVVGNCVPFSDPLTMPVYSKHPNYFIDVLIHELIHQLFTQPGNQKKLEKSREYIFKTYRNESFTTRIHIALNALHTHIYLKFYGKKRLKRDYEWIKWLPDYKKSWDIVKKEGYQSILQEYVKRIK